MSLEFVAISMLVLVFLQILPLFAEIAMEVYTRIPNGSLSKYLLVASGLMVLSMGTLLMIFFELIVGYYFGLFASVLAVVNFLVHSIALFKNKNLKEHLHRDFLRRYSLEVCGVFTFFLLIRAIIIR